VTNAGDAAPLLDASALGPMRGLEGESGADLVAELVELFEAQLPGTVSSLEAALSADSRPELVRLSHQLRGFALTVGAVRLALLAGRLERDAAAMTSREAAAAVAALAGCYRDTLLVLRAAHPS
jgi:HPt (histidine-containing phosphotransfer) domain-containing protein